ncbi:chitosanase, partial [Kitasatospora purpeofusca]|uniref:chitosanase n=1 Tax=Kitasatospora purpeofusca TaxID=67352 RepID=UPI0035DBAB0A
LQREGEGHQLVDRVEPLVHPGSAPGAPGASGPGVPAGPDQGAPPAPATGGNPPAPGSPAPAVPAPVTQPPGPAPVVDGGGLDSPRLKDIAQQLVSSAENSSLDWRAQYTYIEDIHDGRGYTGGIIGFTSGTNDMLQLVRHYRALKPDNVLARYLPALEKVDGSASHAGLDPSFVADWHRAAQDPVFQKAQDDERDRVYFDPAVGQAKADGLRALGQFMYYDALVMHGPGSDRLSFGGIRAAALGKAKPPSQGGDETAFLNAFLDARRAAMKADPSHQDTGRIDTFQRVFLKAGNLTLATPLRWTVYGDSYTIRS